MNKYTLSFNKVVPKYIYIVLPNSLLITVMLIVDNIYDH